MRRETAAPRLIVRWIFWLDYQHHGTKVYRWHVEQDGITACGRRFYPHDRVTRSHDPEPELRCRNCLRILAREAKVG